MKKKYTSLLLALAMCASCLSACAVSDESPRKPWRPPVTPSETTADSSPADTTERAPEPSDKEPSAETEEPAAGTEKPSTETEEPAAEMEESPVETAPVDLSPASVQGVARLGDLIGNYAMPAFYDSRSRYIFVDTESDHNPYDLTWRYGPDTNKEKEMDRPEWDDLYESYVDTCDWSLVFDAEYYKKAFPMLAKLYHDDDALLLEHFQTQGVHEGRQASAGFNVAAYMANCDEALVEAFGDNYECYYFYYMLNQDTQSETSTKNSGGAYPRWLALELSLQQIYEYRSVNRYREDAGADPVEIDPEAIALANYRAWTDAEYNLYAHDWTTDPAYSKEVNDVLWRVSRDHFVENTVKWYSTNTKTHTMFAVFYANSEKHYAAMVSEAYAYFGCSNPYWSNNPDNPFAKGDYTGFVCQFDMYTEVQPHSPYELD